MLDLNPLRSKLDANDANYVMCITCHLFGPFDRPARKALAQARGGRITYRFAMLALARLQRMVNTLRRQQFDAEQHSDWRERQELAQIGRGG